MHSAQQQMFAASASYSQQLSSQMPQPYGGGMGMMGSFGPGMSFGAGGGFSYGQNRSELAQGAGFGNRMVSGIAGMGSAMFNGGTGMIGGGMMGMAMGGVGGGLLGAGIGGVVGAGVNHIFGSMAAGAQEQNMLNRTLSQFQFSNAASQTGRGFTRQDSNAIGNMVRQMERVPEMLTSFGELNRVMDKMGQMGLMSGVRDASEFMNKFRSTIGTLKDMAKMMGTTMEGALQAFGEMRQAGFYNKGDMMRNTLVAQSTGAISGMGTQQVVQMQIAGGNLAHAMGGSRRGGANMMARNIAQIGMANQMGIISNDQIMEMTGKEGSQGIADIAGQMSEMSYRMSQSAPGTLMTLALAETGKGGYTGGIDKELAERVRRGEISLSEMKAIARKKVGQFGRNNKLFYGAHGKRMRAEMAAATGAEGQGMMLQEILGERGWQNPNAQNLVMQRFGWNEEQANLMQQLMPNLQNIGSEIRMAQDNELKSSARQAAQKEHGFDAIKHKITTKLKHYTTDWAKDLGASVKNYFEDWADQFVDDLSGQYSTKVTKASANAVKFGMKGPAYLGAGAGASSPIGGIRLDIGRSEGLTGLGARAMHWAGGGETQGERMDYILNNLAGGKFLHHEGRGGALGLWGQANDYLGSAALKMSAVGQLIGPQKSRGDQLRDAGKIVLDSTVTGRLSYTSKEEMQKAAAMLQSKDFGKDQAAQIKAIVGDKGMEKLMSTYKSMMESGSFAQETDEVKKAQMVFDKIRSENKADLVSKYGGQGSMMFGNPAADMAVMQDRAGGGLSNLGKLMGKGGMKQLDVLAGVQFEAEKGGKRDMSRLSFDSLGKDVDKDFTSATLGKKRGDLEKDIKKALTGDDKTASGADIIAMMDEGGTMAGLAMGLANEGDIYGRMNEVDIKKSLTNALYHGDWDAPGLSAALQKYGLNKAELQDMMKTPEGRQKINKLKAALDTGKISAKSIMDYAITSNRESKAKIAERLHDRGKALNERLRSGNIDESKLSPKGKAAYAAMKKQAEGLINVGEGDVEKYTDNGEVARSLMGLSGDEKAMLMGAAGSENASLMGVQEQLLGKSGKDGALGKLSKGVMEKGKRRDAGADDILNELGIKNAPQEFKDAISAAISGGNSKGLEAGEMDKVAGIITSMTSRGMSSKNGAEAGSTTVSDAEIASAFKGLSENNLKVAGVLANIASGKTGPDAFKDLPGSEKKT